MRKPWFFILAAVVAGAFAASFWTSDEGPSREQEIEAEVRATKPDRGSVPAPDSAPDQEVPAEGSFAEEALPPSETASPATPVESQPTALEAEKKLATAVRRDLPGPRSVRELMSQLTAFRDPWMADGSEVMDGSVTSEYRGYVESEAGLRPIELSRTATVPIELFIEGVRIPYELKNFRNDPYSLVFTLRTGQVIYLKYVDGIEGTGMSFDPRAYTGWMIPKPSGGRPARIALVDGLMPDLGNGEFWPGKEMIQKLLPEELPSGTGP